MQLRLVRSESTETYLGAYLDQHGYPIAFLLRQALGLSASNPNVNGIESKTQFARALGELNRDHLRQLQPAVDVHDPSWRCVLRRPDLEERDNLLNC